MVFWDEGVQIGFEGDWSLLTRLNPNTSSPKQNESSVQEFTSQSPGLGNGNGSNNQVDCGEVTSTCWGSNTSSSLDETLSHHGDNDTSHDVDASASASGTIETSQVVMEILKDVWSTGIRKITFKFSKRREDYDNQSCALVVS